MVQLVGGSGAVIDAALLGPATLCLCVGLGGGCAVPWLIRRLPDPVLAPDRAPVSYSRVAATPHLRVGAATVCAVVGAVLGLGFGWSWMLIAWLPLVPVTVAAGFVDARVRLLPRRLIWPALAWYLLVAAVIAAATTDGGLLVRVAVGMTVPGVVFAAMWWFHPAGMGFGDVRLAVLLGAVLAGAGWATLVVGFYAGVGLFALHTLGRAIWHRDWTAWTTSSPYGPAMLAGALVGLIVCAPG